MKLIIRILQSLFFLLALNGFAVTIIGIILGKYIGAFTGLIGLLMFIALVLSLQNEYETL